MRFQKGVSGNPRGRKKGIPNKSTSMVIKFCDYIVDGGYDKFKEEFDKLNGVQYVEIFIKLAKIAIGDGNTEIMANKKIIELFNEKIKNNGTNK